MRRRVLPALLVLTVLVLLADLAGAPLGPVRGVGDAVLGPVSYDITSLFKDAFLSWPEPQVRAWLEAYWGRARAAGVALPEPRG